MPPTKSRIGSTMNRLEFNVTGIGIISDIVPIGINNPTVAMSPNINIK
jgi:hypothetical protein